MLARLLRRRANGRDAGVALVVVIGLTAIMLLVVGSALTGASSGLSQASSAQGSARALDAAYAGVQDYIAKLNADSTYPQYRNPAAAFSNKSTGNLPPAANTNPAFGVLPTDSWANVPGSTTTAQFRYEVDNSLYGTTGLLRLRSTGKFGNYTKTVVASIQQQGFINYLYFTNYETSDPQISGTGATCNLYLWATPSRSVGKDSCPTISFGANDVLQGPVRSNDTISVCGAEFDGPVTSSNPGTPFIATTSGCTQTASYAVTPNYAPVLSMPATNTSMKAQTYSDVATNPGCLYTGPTQITLNADGTMTVVSPWTKFTRTTSDASAGTNPAACGSLGALHSTKGATVTVPANNLVYVQGVPALATDVNYTPASATTSSTSTSTCSGTNLYYGQCVLKTDYSTACTVLANSGNYGSRCTVVTTTTTGTTNGAVPSSITQPTWNSGTSYTCTGANSGNVGGSSSSGALATSGSSGSAGWIFQDGDGKIQFPLSNESPATNWSTGSGSSTAWDTGTPAYGCRNGDAFVSGTLSGKLTIASDNYIYATGDVLYNNASSDVLGLVGNNGVLVWNPMNGNSPIYSAKDREIDAAILSPAHTFQVQNYDVGGYRGVLTVNGSIAQNYRGPVAMASTVTGVTTSGYAKNYGYDARFAAVTPPYYLKPTSASFKVSSYASTKASYTPAGAAS